MPIFYYLLFFRTCVLGVDVFEDSSLLMKRRKFEYVARSSASMIR